MNIDHIHMMLRAQFSNFQTPLNSPVRLSRSSSAGDDDDDNILKLLSSGWFAPLSNTFSCLKWFTSSTNRNDAAKSSQEKQCVRTCGDTTPALNKLKNGPFKVLNMQHFTRSLYDWLQGVEFLHGMGFWKCRGSGTLTIANRNINESEQSKFVHFSFSFFLSIVLFHDVRIMWHMINIYR
jgi:hypothetical protein